MPDTQTDDEPPDDPRTATEIRALYEHVAVQAAAHLIEQNLRLSSPEDRRCLHNWLKSHLVHVPGGPLLCAQLDAAMRNEADKLGLRPGLRWDPTLLR